MSMLASDPPLPTGSAEYQSYEEYLDSQVTETDMFYLEDKDLARQLVELGNRGTGEPLKREEFELRKRQAAEFRSARVDVARDLAGTKVDADADPFLKAMAEREEANVNGKMMTIVFLRTLNAKKQEVSGYIDFAARLKADGIAFWGPFFAGTMPLYPRSGDLSYHNWETGRTTCLSSGNWGVVAEGEAGMIFKNKRDRKVMKVDPECEPGESTIRSEISTPQYIQVVFYDHLMKRKA